jgi:hypothetical protein
METVYASPLRQWVTRNLSSVSNRNWEKAKWAQIVDPRWIALLLVIFFAGITDANAYPAEAPPQHIEAEVDRSRFLIVDARETPSGDIHVHLKLSNGWRLDPWHVQANVIFLQGSKELMGMSVHVWCPASLGGHAHECNFDYTSPRGDIWLATDHLALTGNTESPRAKPTPTVPIFTYDFP